MEAPGGIDREISADIAQCDKSGHPVGYGMSVLSTTQFALRKNAHQDHFRVINVVWVVCRQQHVDNDLILHSHSMEGVESPYRQADTRTPNIYKHPY